MYPRATGTLLKKSPILHDFAPIFGTSLIDQVPLFLDLFWHVACDGSWL